METTIDTTEYEKQHDKKPVHNKVHNWVFTPPERYKSAFWYFPMMTYKQACDLLKEKAHSGGAFILVP